MQTSIAGNSDGLPRRSLPDYLLIDCNYSAKPVNSGDTIPISFGESGYVPGIHWNPSKLGAFLLTLNSYNGLTIELKKHGFKKRETAGPDP